MQGPGGVGEVGLLAPPVHGDLLELAAREVGGRRVDAVARRRDCPVRGKLRAVHRLPLILERRDREADDVRGHLLVAGRVVEGLRRVLRQGERADAGDAGASVRARSRRGSALGAHVRVRCPVGQQDDVLIAAPPLDVRVRLLRPCRVGPEVVLRADEHSRERGRAVGARADDDLLDVLRVVLLRGDVVGRREGHHPALPRRRRRVARSDRILWAGSCSPAGLPRYEQVPLAFQFGK